MSLFSGGGRAGSAEGTARRAANSEWLELLARIGFLVYGLLHLLIGYIAVQIALGSGSGGAGGGGSADQSGALATLAQSGFGRFALWVGVVGFACLALWQATNAVLGAGSSGSIATQSRDQWMDRGKAAAKTVLYAALAVTTLTFARGGSSSSGQQSADFTASLIDTGPGRALVVAIGLGTIAVGAYMVHKGAKKKFLQDLSSTGGGDVGRAVVRLGQVGYIAKGVVIAVVGVLFIVAAVQQQPGEATGVDGALRTLGEQPYGTALLIAIGLGLVAFGVYLFARARYARM